MANKEMTRKEALEAALYLVKLAADETINTDNAANWEEVSGVLNKMYAQVTKPRKKSDAPTKTQIINANLAEKCYAAMEGQENVTSKWLIEHVNGLMTPQKVTAVMKILIESGKAVKSKEGKTVTYSRA